MLMNGNEYLSLVQTIKQKIQQAQYKATLSVNKELIILYYNIGKIVNEHKSWGNKFIENLASDIRASFPEIKGYSVRKPEYAGQLNFYLSAAGGILKQEGGERKGDPNGGNRQKSESYRFYMRNPRSG